MAKNTLDSALGCALDFDFALLDNENFKEDSVREFIIAPLLAKLGFAPKNPNTPQPLEISLSKGKKTNIQIGSNKSIETDLIPDYTLFVEGKEHCILDAKAPKIDIAKGSKAQKQALSYLLAYPSPFYALCNGRKIIVYESSQQEILLEVDLASELESKCKELARILTTPIESLRESIAKIGNTKSKKPDEWYLAREIPKPILNPTKQGARRHYGSMAYFTKQSWDIVAQNIKAFTDEGDIVLDSFGGSGVTAIEAMMNNRYGIHTDLNPLSIFMVKALSAKVNLGDLHDLSEEILSEFESLRPKNDKEAKALLKGAKYYPNAVDKEFGEVATTKMQDSTLWIPKDEMLPKKGSDVDSVLKLFTKMQLAELAILRKLILRKTTKQKEMRYSLLLAFRNTLTMCNLTYHDTEARKGKGGNTSIYLAYRYRIPKKPTFLNIAEIFSGKIKRTMDSKKELENSPYFYNAYFEPLQRVIKDFKSTMLSQRENLDKTDSLESKINGEKIFQADATNLAEIESESVDFIYTDPPYGAKIPYLDLSTMWNVWLDLPVDLDTREKECIEKGSLKKTRHNYYDLMKASLQEMFRVLKYNRWLVFVFQHEDPKLFQTIIDSAENCGFEYVSCVNQSNGQSSFKNRQMPAFVFKGQFNLYFKKVDNPKTRTKAGVGFDILGQMFKDIEEIIVENDGATLNEMWQHLVPKASINGYFHLIQGKFQTFVPDIERRFEKRDSEKYHLKPNSSFTNDDIVLEKRTRYLIESILKQAEIEGQDGLDFSQIVRNVVPLSKNGVQANTKLIKEILNEIAIPNKQTGEWKLKSKNPSLFD